MYQGLLIISMTAASDISKCEGLNYSSVFQDLKGSLFTAVALQCFECVTRGLKSSHQCGYCCRGWAMHLTPASLSPFKKVKHCARCLFFVIYVWLPFPLVTFISICKSNHTAALSLLLMLSQGSSRAGQEVHYVNIVC